MRPVKPSLGPAAGWRYSRSRESPRFATRLRLAGTSCHSLSERSCQSSPLSLESLLYAPRFPRVRTVRGPSLRLGVSSATGVRLVPETGPRLRLGSGTLSGATTAGAGASAAPRSGDCCVCSLGGTRNAGLSAALGGAAVSGFKPWRIYASRRVSSPMCVNSFWSFHTRPLSSRFLTLPRDPSCASLAHLPSCMPPNMLF